MRACFSSAIALTALLAAACTSSHGWPDAHPADASRDVEADAREAPDVPWVDTGNVSFDGPRSRTTDFALAVQLLYRDGHTPEPGLFRARIDGANGQTFESASGAEGRVDATLPAAFAPATVTFAAVDHEVISIVNVDDDLRGDILVSRLHHGSDPQAAVENLNFVIRGRGAPGSIVTLWANGWPYSDGNAQFTSADTVSMALATAPQLTVVAMDNDDAWAVRNAVSLTVDPMPPAGSEVVIQFPTPPRVPTRATRLQLVLPADGSLVRGWGDFNSPPSSAIGVRPGGVLVEYLDIGDCGTVSNTSFGCTLPTYEGDLAPSAIRASAVARTPGGTTWITNLACAGPCEPGLAVQMPPIGTVEFAGTSLGDAQLTLHAPGYVRSRLRLWQTTFAVGQEVWLIYTFGPAWLDHAPWPRLPDGWTASTVGVGQSGLLGASVLAPLGSDPPYWSRAYLPPPSHTYVRADFNGTARFSADGR